MKPPITAGLLAFVLSLLTSCAVWGPRLVVNPQEMELGMVENGEVIELVINLENRGRGDLTITSVTTSCGCTTAAVESSSLGPGQVAELRISFDSGAHGPDFAGRILREVFIATNDPLRPEQTFRFGAEVVAGGGS